MKTWIEYWNKVDVKKNDECWDWLGAVNKDGYGRPRFQGKLIYAHRLSLIYQEPNINFDKKVVMHICDNPKCCNPKHLLLGTHADNQADKFKKQRQAKGEKNGQSLLTEEQVKEARSKYIPKVMTYKMLAEEYGVCKDTMQKAIRGIYWNHI
jgi:hypothetical protein